MPEMKTAKELGASALYRAPRHGLCARGGRAAACSSLPTGAEAAVYFGGSRVSFDFALSNALYSGIRHIAVATLQGSQPDSPSAGAGTFSARTQRKLRRPAASQRVSETMWYLSTADGLSEHRHHRGLWPAIHRAAGRRSHLQDGLREMLQQHVDSGADVTVGCLEATLEEATGFCVMHIDEKTTSSPSWRSRRTRRTCPASPTSRSASMGIYVFDTSFLIDILQA